MPSHASTSERTTNPGRSRRSYDQFCAMARALDSVGDRWTLLIVRELLAGPRRYTDLHADLPGVSTDVLAARLKHMEGEGLAERRRQPRPASGYVYELTERGRALLPVLTALADWGAPALGKPRATDAVRAHWWALPLRDAVQRAVGHERALVDVVLPEGTFHLRLGDAKGGSLYGEGPASEGADLRLELAAEECVALAEGSLALADGVRAGAVRVAGAGPLARSLATGGRQAETG
ncbi:winged helix-turn-helix transcriptional regulator [Streptomyces spirodelae]|nr:helix-turn-helix domain-containing protein [Streptomyces spirodelae]